MSEPWLCLVQPCCTHEDNKPQTSAYHVIVNSLSGTVPCQQGQQQSWQPRHHQLWRPPYFSWCFIVQLRPYSGLFMRRPAINALQPQQLHVAACLHCCAAAALAGEFVITEFARIKAKQAGLLGFKPPFAHSTLPQLRSKL